MTTTASTGPSTTRPRRPRKTLILIAELAALALVLLCTSTFEVNWARVAQAPADFVTYSGLMVRGLLNNPFAEPYTEYWLTSFQFMGTSLAMAWIGTVIGAILSFPFGFLAARNVAPMWVVWPIRIVLSAIRAIPDVILAILIGALVFGFNPLAGAIALGVGSVGTLGKLTSEAVEGISRGPVEAVVASGAGRVQTLRWGVVPQIMPEVIAFWLYRFEVNIRAGAILGVIGAGGIGALLNRVFESRDWDRFGIGLFVVIVVTMIVDAISGAVRHRVIAGVPSARAARVLLDDAAVV